MRWLMCMGVLLLSPVVGASAWAQEPAPDPAVQPKPPDPGDTPGAAPAPTPVEPTPAPAAPPPAPPEPAAQPATPLPMTPLPVDPAPEPTPPPIPEVPADEPPDYRLYGGIISSGLGAGLIVLAGISMSRVRQLQDTPGFDDYRAGLTTDQDACDEADAGRVVQGAASPEGVVDTCDEARGWEITSYVSLPSGIVLVGLGIYFVLTSDTAQEGPKAAWSLTPVIDLDGASVAFQTVF